MLAAGRQLDAGTFAEHLRSLDLFPQPTERPEFRLYRNWAFDSAALDLALRQAGTTLHAALGRECEPLRFVVSLRLGEPPSLQPCSARLEIAPGLRFKLDPTPSWDEELIAATRRAGRGRVGRPEGSVRGHDRRQPCRPGALSPRRRGVPGRLDRGSQADAARPNRSCAPHRERITWDAPIHCVADIQALPWPPRTINIKPSRLGGLQSLLDVYDYCAAHEIGCYGGGQSELSVGRGQIQYLASLFHPDSPNDVAPAGYNLPEPPDDLPASPLAPAPAELGFRWG